MLQESSRSDRTREGRRWFSDEYFDLIVWIDLDGSISGFQLCYDKSRRERALTWMKNSGFTHERVDDGEESPAKNSTPILVPDGVCPIAALTDVFSQKSSAIDPCIRDFVMQKLAEYGRA